MENIWHNGYTLKKDDGTSVHLTSNELYKIIDVIEADAGYNSLEYYLESYLDPNYDEDYEQKVFIIKEMMKDTNICRDIREGYIDALEDGGWEDEKEVIEEMISDWKLDHNIDN